MAKIKDKLTEFRKFWAGLCQISDSNSVHFLFYKPLENSEEQQTIIVAGGRRWKKPWRRKNVEKGHLAPSNLTFLVIAIDRNGFCRMKEEGQTYKILPQSFFSFCLGT